MGSPTFDPQNVSLIVGGKTISGYADGTFISVERNSQTFTLKVGASGEGARAKSADESAKITVTLLQTSLSNDDLSGFASLDKSSGKGAVPLLLRDNSGRTLCTSLTAWIQKLPNIEFGKDILNRVWVIETDKLDIFIGGN